LQNKTIDNLEADVFFDGNEIQIKLQKQLRYCQKTTIGFKMKYFQELKYEEISEILGTSVGGLKASYHLAVKKIEAFVARN
jgi:RNA polymerase sigma-70 factor (ECF subfamily)